MTKIVTFYFMSRKEYTTNNPGNLGLRYYFLQRYTYRVLQSIQMKLILLCVWAEWAILGGAKTALKFKYET